MLEKAKVSFRNKVISFVRREWSQVAAVVIVPMNQPWNLVGTYRRNCIPPLDPSRRKAVSYPSPVKKCARYPARESTSNPYVVQRQVITECPNCDSPDKPTNRRPTNDRQPAPGDEKCKSFQITLFPFP
ncbi:uncharacterized protein LOC110675648 [Aedes aegypti]|uniref:Uncharacterized protein n=1 Tax=Aedes aegypti TaxID=7159 RepID=A0A6I8TRH8_AEDAE|nr:uncharacterized protein LOC110675648 [Aedes aegypti]